MQLNIFQEETRASHDVAAQEQIRLRMLLKTKGSLGALQDVPGTSSVQDNAPSSFVKVQISLIASQYCVVLFPSKTNHHWSHFDKFWHSP